LPHARAPLSAHCVVPVGRDPEQPLGRTRRSYGELGQALGVRRTHPRRKSETSFYWLDRQCAQETGSSLLLDGPVRLCSGSGRARSVTSSPRFRSRREGAVGRTGTRRPHRLPMCSCGHCWQRGSRVEWLTERDRCGSGGAVRNAPNSMWARHAPRPLLARREEVARFGSSVGAPGR
jgi:hypothetical protein